MTSTTLAARNARKRTPVVKRLWQLAREFDAAADHYNRFTGSHNELLQHEASRAACQLRFVATLIIDGTYSQTQGVHWIRASWRIINAIGRARIER